LPLLIDYTWKTKYSSDEGGLVTSFYIPALSCAERYHRTTGYFSARVLTLAARGIEGLVRNDGRMRLLVGCTLHEPEVEAIEKGEGLRQLVEKKLGRLPLAPTLPAEEEALELLSWMIARGFLEIKVGVPCGPDRRPVASPLLFHEKAGVIADKTGDRLAFTGSLNETVQGWTGNWESFHVFTDWTGGKDHVDAEEETFSRLWADKARRCRVVDVHQAIKGDLLRFLPKGDRQPRRLSEEPYPPPVVPASEIHELSGEAEGAPYDLGPTTDELRRLVWGLIRHGPALPNGGERVGEATSTITPWPHQARAFRRLYGAWPPRLLIADEVGLGKTIEAGLLLRQAWLAGRARRILVLAPKAVLRQWQLELREKFNLNWPIYDGSKLAWYPSRGLAGETERKVDRSQWHREPAVLASSQLMRRRERTRELLEDAEPWDIVVLDEAHHARRKGVGGKSKGPNQLLRLMQSLAGRSEALLLLTATPMQVHPLEIWDLLALLGLPDEWTEAAFTSFFDWAAAPSPSAQEFEDLARLFRAVEKLFGETEEEGARRFIPGSGRLATRKVLVALRDQAKTGRQRLDAKRRRAAVQIMRANSPVARLISRHTRELLRRYYEEGKISTPIASRQVEDEFVELSPEERRLYAAVEDYISSTYDQASSAERNAVGFVMTIYRRRLASSFAALGQTLANRLRGLADPAVVTADEDDVSDDETREEAMDLEELRGLAKASLLTEERDEIAALRAEILKLPVDTKTRVLGEKIRQLRTAGYHQVMVFTQYTDTLDFLRSQPLGTDNTSVMCFSGRGGELPSPDGTWRIVSRDEVKRLFREGKAEILLCTDAAAEGLNFQFCGALINYDMPWNPMRVEQRIGRIDRLGQAYNEIRIVNLHYDDTVETDVYRALRKRIGLFSQFVGKLQPILSNLPRAFAEASLAGRGERERRRRELVGNLEADLRQTEDTGFDLDAITNAELEEPWRPEALYDLEFLDAVLRRPELLPPGVEARPLGEREYEYLAPGMREPVRVTTAPQYYEEHPGSTELWAPGSPVFPNPVEVATSEEVQKAKHLRVEVLDAS
jgi:superfamily II DNA or RNA helicase